MIEADKQKQENEKRQQEKISAYRRFAQTDDGKIIIADLEHFCGFYRPSICETNPNSEQTAFNEGKRRVYLRMQGFIRRKENGT